MRLNKLPIRALFETYDYLLEHCGECEEVENVEEVSSTNNIGKGAITRGIGGAVVGAGLGRLYGAVKAKQAMPGLIGNTGIDPKNPSAKKFMNMYKGAMKSKYGWRGAALGGAVGAGSKMASNYARNQENVEEGVIGSAAKVGLGGALIGAAVPALSGITKDKLRMVVGNRLSQYIQDHDLDPENPAHADAIKMEKARLIAKVTSKLMGTQAALGLGLGAAFGAGTAMRRK